MVWIFIGISRGFTSLEKSSGPFWIGGFFYALEYTSQGVTADSKQ